MRKARSLRPCGAIVEKFEAGTPAPYRFVYGTFRRQEHGVILLASNDDISMIDTLKSGTPELWHSFDRLEFVNEGESLPIDLVAHDFTQWDFGAFSVSDFVDNVIDQLKGQAVSA